MELTPNHVKALLAIAVAAPDMGDPHKDAHTVLVERAKLDEEEAVRLLEDVVNNKYAGRSLWHKLELTIHGKRTLEDAMANYFKDETSNG